MGAGVRACVLVFAMRAAAGVYVSVCVCVCVCVCVLSESFLVVVGWSCTPSQRFSHDIYSRKLVKIWTVAIQTY